MPFLTAGYPSLEATGRMLLGLESAGALLAEVGIPFSDPIADGPDIQRASEWALGQHVGVAETLALVANLRNASDLPVVVMTYANPVLRFGWSRFAEEAARAGVDGILVSDLPPEESPEAWRAFDEAGLDTVVLVAPTTTAQRIPRLLERCRGFVYCLARTGVTGGSAGHAGNLPERVAALRRFTRLPIAVGFGIGTGAQAAALRGVADAVVVGAALMRAVAEDPRSGAEGRVLARVGELASALRRAT